MKIVLAPDSFKGSLTARQVCVHMAAGVKAALPGARVLSLPVADGGEGSADAMVYAGGGQMMPCRVSGPHFDPVDAAWAVLPDGTGVVEMAMAAGLPLAGAGSTPDKTTTYGVGQLMGRALAHGCTRILLCLGGSATNDGGCGAAAALGVAFFDHAGREFVPVGETLCRIARIDLGGLFPAVRRAEITALCDVTNPLTGPAGAAAVYGPQKGADAAMVARLDKGLVHLAAILRQDAGIDVETMPGAGAAGGMGGGAVAFFGARLRPGIETVLDALHFEEQIAGADLVLTGEGRLDGQSLSGKAVSGVARRAAAMGIPVMAVAGVLGPGAHAIQALGVTEVCGVNPPQRPFEQARLSAGEDLTRAVAELLRRWNPGHTEKG